MLHSCNIQAIEGTQPNAAEQQTQGGHSLSSQVTHSLKRQEEARVYTLSYGYSAVDTSICLMCLILKEILLSTHYLHFTDTDA